MGRELYDHERGDVASANLAELPEQAGVVRELSEMLDKGKGWRRLQG
ncbi:MAG: hypothetical protein HXY18_13080 [Bryobacteraceae bacterium]|nr:hypothetical protein [Bryobacteraceae bacterium]